MVDWRDARVVNGITNQDEESLEDVESIAGVRLVAAVERRAKGLNHPRDELLERRLRKYVSPLHTHHAHADVRYSPSRPPQSPLSWLY